MKNTNGKNPISIEKDPFKKIPNPIEKDEMKNKIVLIEKDPFKKIPNPIEKDEMKNIAETMAISDIDNIGDLAIVFISFLE